MQRAPRGASSGGPTSTESILDCTQSTDQSIEELRLTNESMIGPYCLSKFKGEQEAFRLADSGAPVIVACPTLLIGPGDHNLTPPSRMTLAFCQGKLPAYLDCQFNMIDARDIASGLRAAMKVGRPRIRYVLGGANLQLFEWLTIVGGLVGKEVPRWQVSYPLALIVAYASEWVADHLTGRMPMATITGVKLTRRGMNFGRGRAKNTWPEITDGVDRALREEATLRNGIHRSIPMWTQHAIRQPQGVQGARRPGSGP